MFSSKKNINNVYHCKPQFYYIIVEFKRVKNIQACFRDGIYTVLVLELNKSILLPLYVSKNSYMYINGGCKP